MAGLACVLLAAGVPPSQERAAPDEARATDEIKQMLSDGVRRRHREGSGPALRDAHAKGHGCVKAHFAVMPSLAAQMRHGVFARPATFTAWIRFSNAAGTDDHLGLARGMAIKLTGVPGRKILPNEATETTQDFLLVNYPVFNIRTPDDYVAFFRASDSGQLPAFFKQHPDAQRITTAIAAQRIWNPLDVRYFSMTAYQLVDRYVKYSAVPVSCVTGKALHDRQTGPLPTGPNYLRAAMADALATHGTCFDFEVQLQTDPQHMPIEDATVEWSESESSFVPVARITIPSQRFESPAQQTFCENLSYTPWHTLPAHRPVGFVNRIRRVVYDAISALRHNLNGAARREPTGAERFPGSATW